MILVLEAPRPLLGFVDTQKARGTSLYIRQNTHVHDKNNKKLESIVEESCFFPLARMCASVQRLEGQLVLSSAAALAAAALNVSKGTSLCCDEPRVWLG